MPALDLHPVAEEALRVSLGSAQGGEKKRRRRTEQEERRG
jgi:hypothetical protein